MAEETETLQGASSAAPSLSVAPGPHVVSRSLTTRKMMLDVLIGLLPVLVASGIVFQLYAMKQMVICVLGCVAAELIFSTMRRRRPTIGDLSAIVTGMILALSLPGTAPWYVGFIGSFVAIGFGKAVFGGLGQNIFNPAMVGRAFVMIAFAGLLGAPAYRDTTAGVQAITQATPMQTIKQEGIAAPLWQLLLGNTNGSLGETSALACVLGGLYLCIRRTASWQIPISMILGVALFGGIQNLLNPHSSWTVLHHVAGGAALFGAFFIATDPVTSPLTPRGKWLFGFGIGSIVMLLRVFSSYPEGVMFAVLLMNGVVPLINRWTIPRPVGGPAPASAK